MLKQFFFKITNVLIGAFFIMSFVDQLQMIISQSTIESSLFYLIAYPLFLLFCGILFFYFYKLKWTILSKVVLLWCVCALFNILWTYYNSSYNIIQLIRATLWWALAFYYGNILSSTNQFSNLRKIILIALPILSILLIISVQSFRSIVGQNQVNSIFFLIALLPIISTSKNGLIRNIALFAIIALSFYSLKRSACICAGLFLLVYMYDYLKQGRNIIIKVIAVFFCMVMALGIIEYVDKGSEGSIERFLSLEEDGGSGRDIIIEDVFDSYKKLPFEFQVLGRGYDFVRLDKANRKELSAHNDFLEVLYDYGAIGFIIYLCLWFFLIKRFLFLKKIKSSYLLPYSYSMIILLVLSLVSHLIIYPTYFIGLTIFWGYIEGLYGQFNKNIAVALNKSAGKFGLS